MKGLYYLLPIIIILLVIVIISTKRYENFEWSKLETKSGTNKPCIHCPDCGNIESKYNELKTKYDAIMKQDNKYKNDYTECINKYKECNKNLSGAKDLVIPLLKSVIADLEQKVTLLTSELDADKSQIKTLTTNLNNMRSKYVNASINVNKNVVNVSNLQTQLNDCQRELKLYLSKMGI